MLNPVSILLQQHSTCTMSARVYLYLKGTHKVRCSQYWRTTQEGFGGVKGVLAFTGPHKRDIVRGTGPVCKPPLSQKPQRTTHSVPKN
ncbi:unnamed protein product [Merluccius merluccius]